MVDLVDCTLHGPQEETFVCKHLVQSLETKEPVGFFFASEPRGDAWCSQCDEVRVREGGESGEWNARSEDFAELSLLCGACYDKVRVINKL